MHWRQKQPEICLMYFPSVQYDVEDKSTYVTAILVHVPGPPPDVSGRMKSLLCWFSFGFASNRFSSIRKRRNALALLS